MKKSISGGLCSLSAQAAVGSILIFLPFEFKGGEDIVSIGVSVFISFFLIMLFYPAVSAFFAEETFLNNSFCYIKIPIFLLFEAALLLFAIATLCDLTVFSSEMILPNVPKGLIFLSLAATCVIIANGSFTALSKTAVLAFFAVVILTVVIFCFSIPDMDLKYLKPRSGFNVFLILKNSLKLTLMTFAESFIALSVIGEKAADKKSVILGSFVGGGIILLSVLNTLLVFGGEFSSTLRYPYVSAVRTVGEKDVFSGLEGFLYLSVFLCCVIKIALSIFCVKLLSKKFRT